MILQRGAVCSFDAKLAGVSQAGMAHRLQASRGSGVPAGRNGMLRAVRSAVGRFHGGAVTALPQRRHGARGALI